MKEQIIETINNLLFWFKRNLRAIIFWLFLITIFVLFELKISEFISKNILIGEHEVNSRYFDTLYKTIKYILIIIFFGMFLKNYRLSKLHNFWLLFLAATYYILRTNKTDNLVFIPLISDVENSNKYYADLFLYVGFLCLTLFVRNLFNDFMLYDRLKAKLKRWLYIEKKVTQFLYKEDLPIDGSIITDNDKIVTTLVDQINDLYPTKAFVIGVNGEWGNGKTSFLKRLDYKLRYNSRTNDKSPIIFWFNAWQHQEEKSIINNFFNQLKKELANYSGDAKSSINNYLSGLLAILGGKYSKGINFISEYFLKSESTIKDYYSSVNNLISRIDRRVIIFVDDLDRLNKTEIIEVVRILRNVANFHNTIFVCGFDKNYVIKTSGFDNNFLDKIFNLEINLPKLPQNGLLIFFESLVNSSKSIENKKFIIENFNSFFDTDTDISLSDFIIDVTEKEDKVSLKGPKYLSVPLSPSFFFETRRDVKRFYNSLVTELNILGKTKDIELDDYLLFKLLIFKYSWLLNYFHNKNIDIWLGMGSAFKLNIDKIEFLEERKELELIDKLIIYTVLEKLFPNTSLDSYKEGSKKINQRRYFPIYLNNNVFNQSFSYTELLTAHKKLEIIELIDKKIQGKGNQNYDLNDIKSFLLKKENLKTIEEFEQAVEVINKYLSDKMSNSELIKLIHVGEGIDGFKNLASNKIFVKIDDVFGDFLRLLNLYYTRQPKDISLNHEDIDNYLHKEKLSIITSDYVKNKMIELFEGHLENKPSVEEALRILLDCTEAYYEFFKLNLFYDEANKLFINFLKDNFKLIFINVNNNPEDFLRLVTVNSLAAIFVGTDKKEEIIAEANNLLKNKTQWTESDLDNKKFLKDGWNNFLDFFKNTYTQMGLNEEELQKAEKFYDFVYTYIKRDFRIPSETEVLTNKALKALRKKDKDQKQ